MPENTLIKLLHLFPNKPWNWTGISDNPNITWDIVKDKCYNQFNWNMLSLNSNITLDIIRDNPVYKSHEYLFVS